MRPLRCTLACRLNKRVDRFRHFRCLRDFPPMPSMTATAQSTLVHIMIDRLRNDNLQLFSKQCCFENGFDVSLASCVYQAKMTITLHFATAITKLALQPIDTIKIATVATCVSLCKFPATKGRIRLLHIHIDMHHNSCSTDPNGWF